MVNLHFCTNCFVLVDSIEREIGQSAPLELEIWLHDMLYDCGMMMLITSFLVIIENVIKWVMISLNSTRLWGHIKTFSFFEFICIVASINCFSGHVLYKFVGNQLGTTV